VIPVLWSGAGLVAVDKPAGMPVIPGRSKEAGPPLRERLESQLGRRVWVVHRLDHDTSGVLLLALDAGSHRAASLAFEHGRADKRYLALVSPPLSGPKSWSLISDCRTCRRAGVPGNPALGVDADPGAVGAPRRGRKNSPPERRRTNFQLGVEILRWSRSTADTSAALSDLTVDAFVHPWGGSGAFVEVGLGACSYARSVTEAATGWGVTLGVGYDISVARGVAITSVALVVRGRPGNLRDNQQFTVAQALSVTLVDIGLNASFSFHARRK